MASLPYEGSVTILTISVLPEDRLFNVLVVHLHRQHLSLCSYDFVLCQGVVHVAKRKSVLDKEHLYLFLGQTPKKSILIRVLLLPQLKVLNATILLLYLLNHLDDKLFIQSPNVQSQ